MFTVNPIGYFHTSAIAPYDLPRQPTLQPRNEGFIQLNEGCQFEQALEGLEGFDRIWVLFRFHRHNHWKPKVLPPRGGKKQGVFATRSPHRPNFIGLSCVELQSIKKLKLSIINHDLIDGTPILDLKPYLNYADASFCTRQGWLDGLPPEPIVVFQWSPLAEAQIDYLAGKWNCDLQPAIEHRLSQSPLPYANNRVTQINEEWYELAYRTWRVDYKWKEGVITIHHLRSGYDWETLIGKKQSKWNDVPVHQAFIEQFGDQNEN
jgi:tRNA-Thr(GGU) m(6)t(6)A37 methyltransferase TsaA